MTEKVNADILADNLVENLSIEELNNKKTEIKKLIYKYAHEVEQLNKKVNVIQVYIYQKCKHNWVNDNNQYYGCSSPPNICSKCGINFNKYFYKNY